MIFLFLTLAWASDGLPDFGSDTVLTELWHEKKIYYRPVKQDDQDWNGVIYYYPLKKCFELSQNDSRAKVRTLPVVCESEFEKRATEPYVKIADFNKFKAAFLTCVDKAAQVCLRGFISKYLQISMGGDGYADRRDIVFSKWEKNDYTELARLIRKGIYDEHGYKKFPPRAGVGLSGAFEKVDGGWVLESYSAGD